MQGLNMQGLNMQGPASNLTVMAVACLGHPRTGSSCKDICDKPWP
jgi:hypothetical protein